MVWRLVCGCVTLTLSLAGCSSFVSAESETDGNSGSSGGTSTTGPTASSQGSAGTGTGTGGSSVTSNTDATNTEPTLATNTDPSTSGTTMEPTTEDTSGGTDPVDGTTGDETTGDETTGDETTGSGVCDQVDLEPNDAPSDAIEMDDQTCGAPPNTFAGTLADSEDLDRFRYFGEWVCGGDNNPNHVLTVSGEVQVCWFPVCAEGTEQVTCLSGASVTSSDGFQGCCSTDEVVGDINCNGTGDESADGLVWVEPTNNDLVCTNYEIEFSVEDA